MNMTDLNLNSNSYRDEEIEELLQLKAPYDINDIVNSKKILLQQITQSSQNQEILSFIDTITKRIQNKVIEFSNNKNPMHSVIQQDGNFIIENPDTLIGRQAKIENGRVTFESGKAPPGNMNPINVRTIIQAVSIDSRFRPNYFSSKSTNFDVTLPAIQKNVVSMRLSAIELPTTYYAISRTNGNSSCLIMDLSNNGNAWLLTLPDGNYEQSWSVNSRAASIETAMQNAIERAVPVTVDSNDIITANPGGSGTQLNKETDLVFDIDHISGKSLFKAIDGGLLSGSGFIVRFNIDHNGSINNDSNIQLRLGWQLGFRAAQYVSTNTCVSEGICLICGPRYGFISINDYQKNTGPSFMVAYANSVLQDNIITRINLAELQADAGVYQSTSNPGLSTQLNRTREYFGPVDIQRLHIILYDEYGRIIDLNNMDWSFTLAFEVLYN
jgi:hypothetical protein